MTAQLRKALHRLVDAVVAYDEAAGDEIAGAEATLRQNIAAVLKHLDGGSDGPG